VAPQRARAARSISSAWSSSPHDAPTLQGQYVLKDVSIVGAVLVLAATVDGAA
jgi:hypothetical protein